MPVAADALLETHLALGTRRQGKVRDVYQLPARRSAGRPARPALILIVATDRISAFDVVMPTGIAGKGRLLTAISSRWFDFIRTLQLVDDHLVSTELDSLDELPVEERNALEGRSMLCRPARVIPIECVARGYLAGSGAVEYRQSGTVCGVPLPKGLREGDRLPEPIFTPATKAEVGHDENISVEQAASIVGGPLIARLRQLTLAIYRAAADHAERRGLILADTKFEFGFALDDDGGVTDRILLIDEVLTPDSSRFWPAEDWRPGREQPSFDKQFLREWLIERIRMGQWDKSPPGPALPPAIVEATLDRYREAFRRLWGDAGTA